MAMSASALESKIRANLSSRGFTLGGIHSRAPDLAKAVGVGVVGEINASAVVVVPTHAGGTYKVTALSESGMFSKIKAELTRQGFKYGEHSKANVTPSVIAQSVTDEVLSKCTVSIPYDGSGTFQIVGLSASALESSIIAGLLAAGFTTSRGDSAKMAYAVSQAVADEVNGSAVVSGGFAGGGVYPVL